MRMETNASPTKLIELSQNTAFGIQAHFCSQQGTKTAGGWYAYHGNFLIGRDADLISMAQSQTRRERAKFLQLLAIILLDLPRVNHR